MKAYYKIALLVAAILVLIFLILLMTSIFLIMIYKHNKRVMQAIERPTIDSTDLELGEASDNEECNDIDRDLLYCDEESENESIRGGLFLNAQTITDEESNSVPPSTPNVDQETSDAAGIQQINRAMQTQETLDVKERMQVNEHAKNVESDTNESFAPIINTSREGLASYSCLVEEVIDDDLNLSAQHSAFGSVGSSSIQSNAHDVTQETHIIGREETAVQIQETLSVTKTARQDISGKLFNDIGSSVSKDMASFVTTSYDEALDDKLADLETDDDSDSCLLCSGTKKKVPYSDGTLYSDSEDEKALGVYSSHVKPDPFSEASNRRTYDGVFAQAIEEGLERISSRLQNKSVSAAQGDSIKDYTGGNLNPAVGVPGNAGSVGDNNSMLFSLGTTTGSKHSDISVLSSVNPVANYTTGIREEEYVAKSKKTLVIKDMSQSEDVVLPDEEEHVSFAEYPTVIYSDTESDDNEEKCAVGYKQKGSTEFSLSTNQEHLKYETNMSTGQGIVDCGKTTKNCFVTLPDDVSTVQNAANNSEANIHERTTLVDVVDPESFSLNDGDSKTIVLDNAAITNAFDLAEKSSIEDALAKSTATVSTPEIPQELHTSVVESNSVSQKFVEPMAFDSEKKSSSSVVSAGFSSENVSTATIRSEPLNEALDQSISASLGKELVPYAVGSVVDAAEDSFDVNMSGENKQLSDVLPREKTVFRIAYSVSSGSKNTFVGQINHGSITCMVNFAANEIDRRDSRDANSDIGFVDRFLQPRFAYGLQQLFAYNQVSMLYPRHTNPGMIGFRARFLQQGLSQQLHGLQRTVVGNFGESITDMSVKPVTVISSPAGMQRELPVGTDSHLANSCVIQEFIEPEFTVDSEEKLEGQEEKKAVAVIGSAAGTQRELPVGTDSHLANSSGRQELILSVAAFDLAEESYIKCTEENPAPIISTSEIQGSTKTVYQSASSVDQELALSPTGFGVAKAPSNIDTSKETKQRSSVSQSDENALKTMYVVSNGIKNVCVNKVKNGISFISSGFNTAARKINVLYPHIANPNIGDRSKFLQPRLSRELEQYLSGLQQTNVQVCAVDQGVEDLATSATQSIDTTEMKGRLFDESICHPVNDNVSQKSIEPTSAAVFDLEKDFFMENASAKPAAAIIDTSEIQKELPTGTNNHLASSSVSEKLIGSTISCILSPVEISNSQTCEAALTVPVVERVASTIKDDTQCLPLINNGYELLIYNLIEEKKKQGNVTSKSNVDGVVREQATLLVDCYEKIKLHMKALKMDFVDIDSVGSEDTSLVLLEERDRSVTKKLLLSIIKNISPVFVRIFSGGNVADNEWKLLEVLLNDRKICENFYLKRILCYYAVIIEYTSVLNKECKKLLDQKLKISGKIEKKRAEIDKAVVSDGKQHGKFGLSKFKPSVATLKKELSALNANFGSSAVLLSECEAKIKQLENERIALIENNSDYIDSLVSCIISDFGIYDDKANNIVKNCCTIGNFILNGTGKDLEMLGLVLKCSIADASNVVKNVISRMKRINSKKAALLNTRQTRGMLLGSTTNGYEVVSACGNVRSV